MLPPSVRDEMIALLKSFAITVCTAAVIVGAQWLGAHIPTIAHYAITFLASYGSIKYYS